MAAMKRFSVGPGKLKAGLTGLAEQLTELL